MAKPIDIRTFFLVLALPLVFFLINVNQQLAMIFSLFTIIAFIDVLLDKRPTILIERTRNRFKSLVLGIGGYFAYLVVASLALGIGSFLNLNSIVELLAQVEPIFKDNPIFSFVALSFIIPPIETYFQARVLEFLVDKIKASSFDIKNFAYHGIAILVALFLSILHVQAKSLLGSVDQLNKSLVLVFVFFYISALLIAYTKQALESILMHSVANGVSVLISFGKIAINNVILYAIAIGVGFMLFQKFLTDKRIIKSEG